MMFYEEKAKFDMQNFILDKIITINIYARKCPNCGWSNTIDALAYYCPKCGKDLKIGFGHEIVDI